MTTGLGKFRLYDEASREADVLALDALVQEAAKDVDNPPILCGDFDATPESASIRFLTGLQTLAGKSTFFRDAWKEVRTADPGYTYTTDNEYNRGVTESSFRMSSLSRRIDYIFLGDPELKKSLIQVTQGSVVGDEPINGVWASHHNGVMVDLRWIITAKQ